jgi:CMP-N-acetylneuraminic acid synthetase
MKPSVLVVIPARGGSKRLKRKNVLPVLGVPMVALVAHECKSSRYSPRVVVSTEDPEIKGVCLQNSIEVIDRPAELAMDQSPKQEVIVHSVQMLEEREGFVPDIVVSLQPNTPEFAAQHLDEAMDFFNDKVFPGQPIKEVFTVGNDLIQNGAFRIMTRKTVFQKTLSTYVGVFVTDYIDVHKEEDLLLVEKRLREKRGY